MSHILSTLREFDRSNLPFNTKGVGWGPKVVGNVETNDYGIIFLVNRKKPLPELTAEEIIPEYLTVNNLTIATDVQEVTIHDTTITDCHSGTTDYLPPEPIASNRKKYRPLKGGISSIFTGGTNGTLGLLVRDKSDGQVVALSNAHVYAATQANAKIGVANTFPGSIITQPDALTSTLHLSTNQPGSNVFVPEGSSDPFTYDIIGKCKRGVLVGDINSTVYTTPELVPSFGLWKWVAGDTSCDAAIVALSGYDLLNESSMNVVGFEQNGPYEFASQEEIDSLVDTSSLNYGSPVFRSGNTCGPIGYPGNLSSCNLSAYQILDGFVGSYSRYFVSNFLDNIWLRGNVIGSRGGDSGSATFALLSSSVPSASAWKLIGLIYAGPGDFSYSLVTPITKIVDKLNIVPWNGQIPTLSAETSVELVTNVYTPTIELSGRKYFQLGIGGGTGVV